MGAVHFYVVVAATTGPRARRVFTPFASTDRLKFALSISHGRFDTGTSALEDTAVVLVVVFYLPNVTPSAPCRRAFDCVLVETVMFEIDILVSSFPQERIQVRVTEQVVDIPLPHIMEEMMEVERSTWQHRCVLRGLC